MISFLTNDGELKTICLNGTIIAKDGTTEKCARAVLASFDEGSKLMSKWHVTDNLFPNQPKLLMHLPDPSSLDVSRMLGGMISHDNRNMVQDQGNCLEQLISELADKMGIPESEGVLFQGSCHNHLCNMWMGHVENYLACKLEDHMKNDFELIPTHL